MTRNELDAVRKGEMALELEGIAYECIEEIAGPDSYLHFADLKSQENSKPDFYMKEETLLSDECKAVPYKSDYAQNKEDTRIQPRHTESERGTTDGYFIELKDGSKAVLITHEDEKEIAPRFFIDADSLKEPQNEMKKYLKSVPPFYKLSKQCEMEEKEALEILAESSGVPKKLQDWAGRTLSVAKELLEELENNDFEFAAVNSEIGVIELKAFPFQGLGRKPEGLQDIEGYLTYDKVIEGGGNSLYQYAERIVNAPYHQYQHELGKIHLQQFYDESVFPLRDIPQNEWTKEQIYNRDIFSDMFKGYYDYRPRNDEINVCYQHHMMVQEKKEEAMKINITSMIIESIESPAYNQPSSFDKRDFVNFCVPMYDEGLQNLADRVGLFENCVEFNSVEDVINTYNAFMNVYLDVSKDGDVILSVCLNDDAPVNIPLTKAETEEFIRSAEIALQEEGGVTAFIEDCRQKIGYYEKPRKETKTDFELVD